jgi:hypothetical protein
MNYRCEICGSTDETVKFVEDPFELEINDKIVIKELCRNCYNKIGQEI